VFFFFLKDIFLMEIYNKRQSCHINQIVQKSYVGT